jgi:DNA-binding NarL/FixJ family response regulator
MSRDGKREGMITVSIVDDESQLRQSIETFINGSPGFRCLSAYGSAEAALQGLVVVGQRPDVVLMDIHMAGMNGIECVERLKELLPEIQIVMLTVYEDTEQIFRALASGASGYLLKRLNPDKLLEAIQEVHEGGSPMSHSIARKVVASFQKTERAGGDQPELLSPREQTVLDCLAKGLAYKQIADQLGISVTTIRSYLRRIYEKLHVQSRSEAVARYLHR